MTFVDRAIAFTLPAVPKPIVRKISGRYIAGETVDQALTVAAGLNNRGIRATLDILGEDIYRLEQAHRAVNAYIQLLEEIGRRKLDANISIKLTQLGLKVDTEVCLELTDRLLRR